MSIKTITYQEIREVSNEVIRLQNKLMELGLIRTFHTMHEVNRQIGWEISDILSGIHPITSLGEDQKEESDK